VATRSVFFAEALTLNKAGFFFFMTLVDGGPLSLYERIEQLKQCSEVVAFNGKYPLFEALLSSLSLECSSVILALIAAKQEHLFEKVAADPSTIALFRPLLEELMRLEGELAPLGGVFGYQQEIEKFLLGKEELPCELIPPEGPNFTSSSPLLDRAIAKGIESLPLTAEFYPIGGAADRLGYYDQKRGKKLPAAPFQFMGKSLLEGVITDVQAREFLYFTRTGRRIQIPLVLMTSDEKENDLLIREILEEKCYFGRDPATVRLIKQPAVPCVDRRGKWVLKNPFQLLLKPGGHGAIWQLAKEKGIFSWLKEMGKKYALIRQINNPIAGLDSLLLSLSGYGQLTGKIFGFASCQRLVHASEGMNVVKKKAAGIAVSNIEYCQFEQYGIQDKPIADNSPYSSFPSNTNILFAKLDAIEEALVHTPFPGLVLNFKKETGLVETEEVARLETMMQNIADALLEEEKKIDQLSTFITFNERKKTISAIKRQGESLVETAKGCFYDYLRCGVDLLESCGVAVPLLTEKGYLAGNPEILFSYHPSLGPLYSIIREKIRGGRFAPYSELHLALSDLVLEGLDLQGSLLIQADAPMGHREGGGMLSYSNKRGKCILRNVTVANEGIDRDGGGVLWNLDIKRKEVLTIELGEGSAFIAEGVCFKGNITIKVPADSTIIAEMTAGEIVYKTL